MTDADGENLTRISKHRLGRGSELLAQPRRRPIVQNQDVMCETKR